MFETRDLAVYAAIVSTLGGLWSLYLGLVLDRARIKLKVYEGSALTPGGPSTPILMVRVSNRGRRATQITSIARVEDPRKPLHAMSNDLSQQVPIRLSEGAGQTLVHGAMGGHTHGSLPLDRWHVSDGAGRVYPLGERWRQRVESLRYWRSRRRNRRGNGG